MINVGKFREDGIVIFGTSEDIFPDLDDFIEYLHSLVDGSWLKDYGHLTGSILTYLRYTKAPTNRCNYAEILLLTSRTLLRAEIHVETAKKYKPPIETGHRTYHLGYPIQEDEIGPLVFIFKEPFKAAEVPSELGFPASYRGGAYVSLEALEFIRKKGRRERIFPAKS